MSRVTFKIGQKRVYADVERTHNGLSISAVYNGYLVSRLYLDYTKAEAVSRFVEYLKTGIRE